MDWNSSNMPSCVLMHQVSFTLRGKLVFFLHVARNCYVFCPWYIFSSPIWHVIFSVRCLLVCFLGPWMRRTVWLLPSGGSKRMNISSSHPMHHSSHTLQRESHLCAPRKGIAAALVPIFTLMCLWAIHIFPGSVNIFSCSWIADRFRLRKVICQSVTDTWTRTLGLWTHNFFSGNICFGFSVFCLSSAARIPVNVPKFLIEHSRSKIVLDNYDKFESLLYQAAPVQ